MDGMSLVPRRSHLAGLQPMGEWPADCCAAVKPTGPGMLCQEADQCPTATLWRMAWMTLAYDGQRYSQEILLLPPTVLQIGGQMVNFTASVQAPITYVSKHVMFEYLETILLEWFQKGALFQGLDLHAQLCAGVVVWLQLHSRTAGELLNVLSPGNSSIWQACKVPRHLKTLITATLGKTSRGKPRKQ